MSEEEKSEQRFELEKHLHEQYAINTNAHTASFISFVVALLVLFGAFGYVYAHTLNVWSSSEYDQLSSIDSGYLLVPVQSHGLEMTIPQKDLFTLDQFLGLALVVSGVLCFLACLSLQIGFTHRRDQVIIQEIRERHGLRTKYETAKDKEKKNYIPDFYQLFFLLFVVAQIFVFLASLLKVAFSCACSWRLILIILCFMLQFSGIYISFWRRGILYEKFEKLKKDNPSEQSKSDI